MATLTITTTPAQDARLIVAYGAHLGLGRSATAAEIKSSVVEHIKSIVYAHETAQQAAAAAAAVVKISPT